MVAHMRRFCPSCGAKLTYPTGRFCPEYGATLTPEPTTAQPAERPSSTETRSRRWPLLASGGGQILSTKIQNRLSADTPEPSRRKIESYHRERKDTQFSSSARGAEPAKSYPLSEVQSGITRKWRWRAACAPGLAAERCSNGTQPRDGSDVQS